MNWIFRHEDMQDGSEMKHWTGVGWNDLDVMNIRHVIPYFTLGIASAYF